MCDSSSVERVSISRLTDLNNKPVKSSNLGKLLVIFENFEVT